MWIPMKDGRGRIFMSNVKTMLDLAKLRSIRDFAPFLGTSAMKRGFVRLDEMGLDDLTKILKANEGGSHGP